MFDLIKLDVISELDENELIPTCARRNFELEGDNMVDAKLLPDLNVMECQKLCGKIDGCQYFSSTTGQKRQCLLKPSTAVESWEEGSISPESKVYSGPAACGNLNLTFFRNFSLRVIFNDITQF